MKNFEQEKLKFIENFNNNIKPKIKDIELERIKNIKRLLCTIVVVFAMCFVILYDTQINNANLYNTYKICGYLLMPILCAMCFAAANYMQQKYAKKKLMPFFCNCFTDLKYNSPNTKPNSKLYKSGLINKYDDYSLDDTFSGEYKDRHFEIIEGNFIRKIKYGGKSSEYIPIIVFKGVILKITMDKYFKAHILLKPETLFKNRYKKLELSELEDVSFEKKFDMYTNNELEARVIITPLFMEKLLLMKNIFSASKISCAFYNKTAYIAFRTHKDAFKLGNISQSYENPKIYYKLFNEITSIYDLIDYLKLTELK